MSVDLEPGVHQEQPNVHTRAVAWVGVATVVITLLGIFIADCMIYIEPLPIPTPGALIQSIHTGPVERQQRGMIKTRDSERRLRQLGWVDRARGIAHVPMQDAKRLWLARQAERPEVEPEPGAPEPEPAEPGEPPTEEETP